MSQFKGSNGKWKTISLFLEHHYDTTEAIFTMKGEHFDYKGKQYLSPRQLFVGLGDPTGYEFSQQYLDGWEHWKAFCASPRIRAFIEDWKEELEVKLRSKAITTVVADSESESRSSVASAKWLSDRGWVEKRAAGKPSKEEVQRELKVATKIKDEHEDDWKRMIN